MPSAPKWEQQEKKEKKNKNIYVCYFFLFGGVGLNPH
jgi:hypothetical protein